MEQLKRLLARTNENIHFTKGPPKQCMAGNPHVVVREASPEQVSVFRQLEEQQAKLKALRAAQRDAVKALRATKTQAAPLVQSFLQDRPNTQEEVCLVTQGVGAQRFILRRRVTKPRNPPLTVKKLADGVLNLTDIVGGALDATASEEEVTLDHVAAFLTDKDALAACMVRYDAAYAQFCKDHTRPASITLRLDKARSKKRKA